MTTMLNAASATPPALRCPKCAAEMATYERSGVVVDQCRECRGIYLDRGELERLIDAEEALVARAPSAPTRDAHPAQVAAYPAAVSGYPGPVAGPVAGHPAPGPRPGPSSRDYRAEWHDQEDDWDERRDDRRGANDERGWDDRRRPAKKRSLLGELLEGFGG
jgi:Zn-finger nucleic acid-binding protein